MPVSVSPATIPENDVLIFVSEKDVGHPFEVLAIINTTRRPGPFSGHLESTLPDCLPAMKKRARKLGANGIIIDHQVRERGGMGPGSGISVVGRAIRIE
jgi:hypothetical protein